MNSEPAPIAVFAYNRPDHLRRTLQSLMACEGADAAPITVFIDGPKNAGGGQATEQVRQVAAAILGDGADIRVADTNMGLSKSIVGGVGEVLDRHGSVIVVEDDLALAPSFLTYMNAALERYQSDESVYQISGHMFDVPEFAERKEALFLPFTTTWGWATWSRAWKAYDGDATGWERLRKDRALRRRFDLDGAYPYTWLMERQQRGQSDSWGIRWYWSVFQRDGICLFPPISLVNNTGQDGSGTHGGGVVADFRAKSLEAVLRAPQMPDQVGMRKPDFVSVRAAIWRQNGGWKGWALKKLRELLKV